MDNFCNWGAVDCLRSLIDGTLSMSINAFGPHSRIDILCLNRPEVFSCRREAKTYMGAQP